MQEERGGLRFAALMFVGIAAFLAVIAFVAFRQANEVAQFIGESDLTGLDSSQFWLVPILLGGGTIVVLAIAVGFWRAAANAASQPYVTSSSYSAPQPVPAYQPAVQPPSNGGPDPTAMMAIKDHLINDRMIQAVKLYRETTGVGLKEAHDAVKRIKADM